MPFKLAIASDEVLRRVLLQNLGQVCSSQYFSNTLNYHLYKPVPKYLLIMGALVLSYLEAATWRELNPAAFLSQTTILEECLKNSCADITQISGQMEVRARPGIL